MLKFTAGLLVKDLIEKLKQYDPEAIVEVKVDVKKCVGSRYNVCHVEGETKTKVHSISFVTLRLHNNNLINEAPRWEGKRLVCTNERIEKGSAPSRTTPFY